eukprot:6214649-Pleurochrysis_carterae.AAC.2
MSGVKPRCTQCSTGGVHRRSVASDGARQPRYQRDQAHDRRFRLHLGHTRRRQPPDDPSERKKNHSHSLAHATQAAPTLRDFASQPSFMRSALGAAGACCFIIRTNAFSPQPTRSTSH